MQIDLTPIPDDLKPGATLSKRSLARRFDRKVYWVQRQGTHVRARGETWTRVYKNGGRVAGYELIAKLEPMIAAVKSGSAGQRVDAAG